MKIRTIRFSHLRNEEHLGFHLGILKTLQTAGRAAVPQPYTAGYAQRCEALNEVVDIIRKSVLTGEMITADDNRISLFRGLRDQLKGALHHFEPTQCEAAIRMYLVVQHYSAIPEKSRNERSGALSIMLGLLHEEYAADMETLGLAAWVHALEEGNQAYKKLEAARLTERANLPHQKTVEERHATDCHYKALADHINALVFLAPETEGLAELIAAINVRVAQYSQTVAQRAGMRKSRENDSEPALLP